MPKKQKGVDKMAEQYFIKIAEAIEESKGKMKKAKNLYDFEMEEYFIKEAIASLKDNSGSFLEDLIDEVELYLYIYTDSQSTLDKVPKNIGEERERNLERLRKQESDVNQDKYKELYEAIDNLVDWLKKA